jgi:hypothetical protein
MAAWIPIIISIISLLISLTSLYFAYLRPADVRMIVGRSLLLSNSYLELDAGRKWGGVSFVIPLTFHNWSPVGSVVHQVRIVIEKQGDFKNFSIVWGGFLPFQEGKTNIDERSMAHPLAIPGKSTITKFVRFDWSPSEKELEIEKGYYNLTLYAWTSDINMKLPKRDLKENIKFEVDQTGVDLYQQAAAANNLIPIEIPIGVMSYPNEFLTREEVLKKYG